MTIQTCLRACLLAAAVFGVGVPVCADTGLSPTVKVAVGAIVGVIKNSSQAPVAGATLTATRTDGTAIRAAISASDGVYSFPDLAPGSWTISAEADGYPDVSLPPVAVTASKATRTDLVLNASDAASAPAIAAVPAATAMPATPAITEATLMEKIFNGPKDHTIVGSTESFRSGEFQVEQISLGGDFHYDNVRARILTIAGLFSTTTPRNDASSSVGQWNLSDAYRYVSEANAGYHFDVNHGLNIDAGIFVSYIGLFSYYNFDNWTYQPSFVSSNTPWFFNGLRIQWFPTNKLKIEPWIINGWQSYARYNGHLGFGGQILWMPTENLKLVFNNYGVGTDNLGLPRTVRYHTDDSIEYKYFSAPGALGISKAAFSFTADAGCQSGGGINCSSGANKSAFLGWMLYNRLWFHNDLFAVTLGGGAMNNPGRYLTLLPPINGATAASGTPYFTENPGQKIYQWDSTINLQYMPKEWITWWTEFGFRHSSVPYFSGQGGVTPPGGNNGSPQNYVCNSGASAGTSDPNQAQSACGEAGVWYPDLRTRQTVWSFGVLVKF
jgi:hypothetical protein